MDNATRTRIDLEQALGAAIDAHPATAEHRALSLSYDARFARGIDAASLGDALALIEVVADELRAEEQRVASYRQRVAAWRAGANAIPDDLAEADFLAALEALGPGLSMHLDYAEQRLAARQQEWREATRLAAEEATKRLFARGGGRLTTADLAGKEVAS